MKTIILVNNNNTEPSTEKQKPNKRQTEAF